MAELQRPGTLQIRIPRSSPPPQSSPLLSPNSAPPHRIPRKPVGVSSPVKPSIQPSFQDRPSAGEPLAKTSSAKSSSSHHSETTLAHEPNIAGWAPINSPTIHPIQNTSTGLTGSTLVSQESNSSSLAETLQEEDENQPQGPSKLSKAWQETKHFAGGLIHHPSESTRHYSVLRHSHGIVFYQGPESSIAISIFADRILPNDRKIWLQQKGWTGKTGWRAKQLFGANGGWLDVTPSLRANADQLPRSSERAWQRDCKRFIDREGYRRGHDLRETCMVRIPAEAEDGYFRLVLCGNGKPKNKLCPSPIFRVMSVSTSPSSIKGASLSTMPLEVGLKALSVVANNAAVSAVQPLAGTLQNVIGQYLPNFWEQQLASAAYSSSGLDGKVATANEVYQKFRDISYQHIGSVDESVYQALDGAPLVGNQDGPAHPYPIRMSSTIIPGPSSLASTDRGTPTANLKRVREEVTMTMNGVYFGWGRITPTKLVSAEAKDRNIDGLFPLWHPALIKIVPVANTKLSVTYGAVKTVSAYLIHDFDNLNMEGSKIELAVMGFLREMVEPTRLGQSDEERLEQDSDNRVADIAIVQASLSRPAWNIETIYTRGKDQLDPGELDADGKPKKLTRSVTDRYVDARQAAQRQVDRVPIHRLGLRRNIDVLKEQSLGTGGIYVPR